MKKVITLFLFLVYIFPQSAFAVRSISIFSNKSSLSGDDLMTISASTSGFVDGEKIYLKGAFFKEGSTNYFALTKSGESWIKNSKTFTEQKQVEIGSWDGNVEVKPDFDDSGFTGKGDYKFKVGFYYLTSGGNASSINWSSNNIAVVLDQPVLTAVPTSVAVIKSTSTSTIVKTVTNKPSAVNSPTIVAAKNVITNNTTQKSKNFAKIAQDQKTASNYAKIVNTIDKPKAEQKQEVLGIKETNYLFYTLPIGFILLLIAVGILVFKNIDQIKIWILKQ